MQMTVCLFTSVSLDPTASFQYSPQNAISYHCVRKCEGNSPLGLHAKPLLNELCMVSLGLGFCNYTCLMADSCSLGPSKAVPSGHVFDPPRLRVCLNAFPSTVFTSIDCMLFNVVII